MRTLESEIVQALRQLTEEKMASFEGPDREEFLQSFDEISSAIQRDNLTLSRVSMSAIDPSDLDEPGFTVYFELTPSRSKPKLRLVS